MEEVDKILIHTMRSIGCNIDEKINKFGEFTQELFVECVSKVLNTINPNENLPTQLPPNTGVKYRICTKFANLCQQLGYRNDIGYQTFLYSNEPEIRRLLMFLVEKLPKEYSSTQQDGAEEAGSVDKRGKNLQAKIAQQISNMLSQYWTPNYCKQNSLRVIDDNTILKEGCKSVKQFHTVNLTVPSNYLTSKNKYSKETQGYYENYCKYVTNQVNKRANDLICSLMERNTLERIKEQQILNQDLQDIETKKQQKQAYLNEMRNVIKNAVKSYDDNTQTSLLTQSDMFEIENELQSSLANLKNQLSKGSRFSRVEKMQYTKDDDSNVTLPTSTTEEKREEEIKNLKQRLEDLNNSFNSLEETIKQLNQTISDVEKQCVEQVELNKKLEESLAVKRKTVHLIEEAPKNIAKLKEEIGNFDQKMKLLEQQWIEHKKPLEDELFKLNELAQLKKKEMQNRIEEIKVLKDDLKKLNSELQMKDDDIASLTKDYENLPKDTANSNRQFYTRRILEIVSNIGKQKREIEKVLIETKGIQKEINQLTGKLERIFNETDELIFKEAKEAKKDDSTKNIYKLFININENYEKLFQTIEGTSVLQREIHDLEDQVDSESQNNVYKNMESLIKDYKQIKEENEQLSKTTKSSKK